MREVQPEVFIVGSTKVNERGMRAWLDHIGAQDFQFPEPSTDAEKLVMAFGKRCYMSFIPGLNPNVTKVREDMTAFIDNILKSKHGSVLAHVTYNFAIEGVSRVFTLDYLSQWRFLRIRQRPALHTVMSRLDMTAIAAPRLGANEHHGIDAAEFAK